MSIIQGLLELELRTIYQVSGEIQSRVLTLADGPVKVVYGWSPEDHVLALGPDLVADADCIWAVERPFEPGTTPETIKRAVDLLGRISPTASAIQGGPSFLFPRELPDPCVPKDVCIYVSDDYGRTQARQFQRPLNWEQDEWSELIAGHLGPWAIAAKIAEPISICHTPAYSSAAAEAGVWTHPNFRGRGLAPAVVHAWWNQARLHWATLFYSTDGGNAASQAVATKLGLCSIGWLWTVK